MLSKIIWIIISGVYIILIEAIFYGEILSLFILHFEWTCERYQMENNRRVVQ